jgi:hypothetical protein
MVIKATLIHSGWSYGNGDDQYDNESIGSTRTVQKLEKSMENSSRNKKSELVRIMCTNNTDKHTDEEGWTTIDVNSSRKPKTKNNKQTLLESIISTINIETNNDKNGAPKVTVDSPTRNNRYTLSEATNKQEEEAEEKLNRNEHKKQQQEEEEKEQPETSTDKVGQETTRTKATGTEEHKRKKEEQSHFNYSNKTRNNKGQEEEEYDTKNEYERKSEITTVSKGEEHKENNETTTTRNDTTEESNNDKRTETERNNWNGNRNSTGNDEDKNQDKNNNTPNNNEKEGDKNNNNERANKARVNILEPGDMNTYAFTVSWRPEHKRGQDGKIIIRMLMREMAHRTPSIIFHPTNSSTSPVPRDIHNINNDFPKTPANYDDFFDQMINRDNTNQRTFMKVTMPHDEKELQKKLSNYLFHNKIYMNSPFIDDNTLEQIGFIENGHSRLVFRPTIEMKIRKGLKEVMEGESLTPQQIAQLKHLSSPIRVECHRGTIRAGASQNQIVCEGIVLKTTKSQSKLAMELLSMLPEKLLGEHYRIIPKSLGHLLGYELYGRIVADTVQFQNKLRPLTIMHCHPRVFDDHYDSVKLNNSNQVRVDRFIKECCGAISIEETNETKEKGKYIVVVPEERIDSARTAIGKMFQEFQKSGGRPAAMACLQEYQNFPLVNDNVTISGHAQRLSERIRDRYRNRPKTTYNQNSSPAYSYHGSTSMHDEQRPTQTTTTAVPRSIIKNQSSIPQQWPQSPIVQRQQPTPTNQGEERTVMSNLSPDDSAKTMMTNVSRMVETLGTVVNTLATNNAHMAQESANTNNTIKQMMMQQSETMNTFMMIMARNEERRQEVPPQEAPIREIPIRERQPASTPTSTITNSQFSLSQQSTSANKRKIDGIADDETTAASTTMIGTDPSTEEDDIDAMLEEQTDAIDELRNEQEGAMDVTMADNNETAPIQQETTTRRITTVIAEGDFEQQFNINKKSNVQREGNVPIIGANRQ